MKVLPVSSFDNTSARVTRKIEVQPLTDSGITKMKGWLAEEKWESVLHAETANEKTELFENMFKDKYNEYFPKKIIKVANDDQPWFTPKLKDLDRIRKRLYHNQRRSPKWKALNKKFKKEVKLAKHNFYKKLLLISKRKTLNSGTLWSKGWHLMKISLKNHMLKASATFLVKNNVT